MKLQSNQKPAAQGPGLQRNTGTSLLVSVTEEDIKLFTLRGYSGLLPGAEQ